MSYSIFRFTLNMHNHRSQSTVKVFKGDTAVKLIISLTDGGNIYKIVRGCTATLTGTKANGSKLKHDCIIEGDVIIYLFDKETTDCSGLATCEITLYDENGRVITAPKFTIDVAEKEVEGSDPISEYSSEAIATVMGAAAGEYARQEAESARQANEEQRQESYNNAETIANEAKRSAESVELELQYRVHTVDESNVLYGTNSVGNQSAVAYSVEVKGNKLVKRNNFGVIKVPDDPREFVYGSDGTPLKDENDYYVFTSDKHAAINTIFADKRYGSRIDTVVETLETEKAEINKFKKDTEIRLEQLESVTLKFTEDSSMAYEKIVPANSAKYALVNKVGGMTYKIEPELYPVFNSAYNYAGFDVSADGTVTASNTTGSSQEFSDSLTYYADEEYYFTLSSECPSITYAAILLQYVKLDEETGSYYANEVAYPLNTWIPKIDYSQYVAVDADFIFKVAANAGTVTFKPVLAKTEDVKPKLLDTKVTELVSEGANLFDISKSLSSACVDNGDGSYTLTNNGDSRFSGRVPVNIPANTAFTISGTITKTGAGSTDLNIQVKLVDGSYSQLYPGSSFSPTTATYSVAVESIAFYIATSDVGHYFTFKDVMVNYGTTAAPYKPYRADAVDTFAIANEIKALDGYGKGVNADYYNYIDFERKVFVQNTFRKVFDGTENFTKVGTAEWTWNLDATAKFYGQSSVNIILCNQFTPKYSNTNGAVYFGGSASQGGNRVIFYDEQYATVEEWKAHLAELYASGNPLIVEYALAEPREIDISAYLTDDNFIKVEGGGTIKAVNELKLELDAPTTISYVSQKGS